MQRTPLTPERFQNEKFEDYRLRRAKNRHDSQAVRQPVENRYGEPTYLYSRVAPSRNGGHTGAGMANIRAARKARNVRRHRAH